jgi:predicted anti-sigma-YlaC factor YlaD
VSAKASRRIEIALDVADRLEAAGEHFDAEAVRSLCRACRSYQTTLGQLHKDNMALRESTEPYVPPPYPKPRVERVPMRADLVEHAARLIGGRDPKLADLFRRMSQEAAA